MHGSSFETSDQARTLALQRTCNRPAPARSNQSIHCCCVHSVESLSQTNAPTIAEFLATLDPGTVPRGPRMLAGPQYDGQSKAAELDSPQLRLAVDTDVWLPVQS